MPLNSKNVYIILIVMLLNACHNHKPKPTNNLPNNTQNWQNIKSWSFNGRMAINDGKNSGSSSIKWNVSDDSLEAQFKAPFGRSWKIFESPGQARISSSKHGDTLGHNAQILISNELNWDFPWNKLKYWLRGYKSNSYLPIHQKTFKSIEDDGWEITYPKWTQTPIGPLPKKIEARKGSYFLKLIIYNWEIN